MRGDPIRVHHAIVVREEDQVAEAQLVTVDQGAVIGSLATPIYCNTLGQPVTSAGAAASAASSLNASITSS